LLRKQEGSEAVPATSPSIGKYIGEVETVSLDALSDTARDGLGEHRPGMTEGVELAALATRVHACGEVGKEFRGKVSACKSAVELFGINTGKNSLEAGGDHLSREEWRVRGAAPQGKDRLDPRSCQLTDPVRPDIFQKQIAKSETADAFPMSLPDHFLHPAFVLLV
jgi:hypothetical protein